MFGLIQDELRRSGFEELVAAGLVLTGGSARMEGAVELAEEIFHMPVRLAVPDGVRGMETLLHNPIYATSIGMLHYARQAQSNMNESGLTVPEAARHPKASVPVGNVFGRMKTWLQGNF